MTARNALVIIPLLGLVGLTACQPSPPEAQRAPAALPATETSKDFGSYVVHFNALATDQLTPEVAKNYDIVRSKNRAMLNVSIIKKAGPGTLGKALSGQVSASAVNLTGQLKSVTLREIAEGDAIYFIGEVPVAHGETLIFTVDGVPEGEADGFSIRFQKQFYSD